MQCPKCQTDSLTPTTVREISVDRCTACHGVWFDAQELPALLYEEYRDLTPLHGEASSAAQDEKLGKCPRDATPLLRMYSAINPAVIVDTYLQCRGIWLDGGEFEELRQPGRGRER
jgi:Zn-finger nucleic acid-binding protein